MTQKINLSGEQIIKGNLKQALQTYRIFYYPPEEKLTDKVWLYFDRKEKDKYHGIKSLCFTSATQLKEFIFLLMESYLYLREKREAHLLEHVPISEYRLMILNKLTSDLRTKKIENWRQSQ